MIKTKQAKYSESEALATIIAKAMQDKKAKDVTVLDLRDLGNSMFNFFVICHANSPAQVDAIADWVHICVKTETGANPWKTEGYTNAEWIVLDYVDVVAHIFIEKARDFYKLESLWADAKKTSYEDVE